MIEIFVLSCLIFFFCYIFANKPFWFFLLLTSYFLIFFVMFEHFQTVILSPLILINIKNKHVNVKEVNGEFGLYWLLFQFVVDICYLYIIFAVSLTAKTDGNFLLWHWAWQKGAVHPSGGESSGAQLSQALQGSRLQQAKHGEKNISQRRTRCMENNNNNYYCFS